jgi:putative flippase GtrA
MMVGETLMNPISTLTAKTSGLTGQLFRSLVVGGGAFVVDFAVLYALTEFGRLHYLVSAAIAFLVGIAINYGLSIAWVFVRRTLANRVHEFTIFALIGVAGLLLNLALMWFFTEISGLHYLHSKAVAAILIFLFKFATRKTILFSEKGTDIRQEIVTDSETCPNGDHSPCRIADK